MSLVTTRNTDHLNFKISTYLGVCLLASVLSERAFARTEFTDRENGAPCARVQSFEGDVQILDESRTHVKEVRFGEGVSCGSWISATAGWIRMKHRDGWVVSLSPGAFAQLLDPPSLGGEQFLLYRGQAYIKVANGSPEVKLLTANARIRVTEGSGVVAYIDSTEETQWIGTSGVAYFENRFQDARSIKVSAGESSSLNFRQLRVVPSEPAALSSVQVKKRLEDFRLDESEVSSAFAVTRSRQDRRIASVIGAPPVPVTGSSEEGTAIEESHSAHKIVVREHPEKMRAPAAAANSENSDSVSADHEESNGAEKKAVQGHSSSEVAHSGKPAEPLASSGSEKEQESDYSRHPGVGPEVREEVRSMMTRKIAGNGPVTDEMVSPDDSLPESPMLNAGARRPPKVILKDANPSSEVKKGRRRFSPDAEKKRLLDELSKIGLE